MKILALDVGTKTGWCIGNIHSTDQKYSGVQNFALKRGESQGMRFLRFDRWLEKMVLDEKPDVVVFEQPFHLKGHANTVLNGMIGILLVICSKHNVEHFPVEPPKLKKYATGKGNCSKDAMVAEATRRYNKPILDDNEADALLMWDWAREEGI